MRTTYKVVGERNPWQALADAMIIQAIKDYRGCARMMKRIQRQIDTHTELSDEEIACLKRRYFRYARMQDDAGDFFCSNWFGVLTDIDGFEVLYRLESKGGK